MVDQKAPSKKVVSEQKDDEFYFEVKSQHANNSEKVCVDLCVCARAHAWEGLTNEGKWQLIMQSVETTLQSSGSILWISLRVRREV